MTVLPADTPRTSSDDTLLASSGFVESNDVFAIYSPTATHALYEASRLICQADAPTEPLTPLRIAVVQGAVSFTDHFLGRLRHHGIQPLFVGPPEAILRRLDRSLEEWDIVVYLIGPRWQHALDFARAKQRVRDRHGAPPCPRLLLVSFADHLPTTVQWFKRTAGTDYAVFTSEQEFVQRLWAIRAAIERAKRSFRLHLRFVHSGHPNGLGCIPGEKIEAVYGSFLPGHEDEIPESKSVLRFLNILAASRWRSRSAPELIEFMARHPLYSGKRIEIRIPAEGSMKTYVARAHDALSTLWRRQGHAGKPPTTIARESRGKKEIAYRLLCTAEFEHI